MYQSWKRFTKHVTSYFCGKRESSVLATLSFMFNHCFWQSLLLHQNFFVELQYVLQSCVSVIITNTFGGKTITTYIFWVLIRMLHLKFSIERIIALKCLFAVRACLSCTKGRISKSFIHSASLRVQGSFEFCKYND